MTTSIKLVDIIQSLGIIVTLIVAIWQMSLQTRHVRAANDLALLSKFDEINKLWITHSGVWKELDTSYDTELQGTSQEVLSTILFMVFNTFELAFRHHKKYKLLENDAWADWCNLIQAYREKTYLYGWWEHNAHEYSEGFQFFVNSLPGPKAKK